MDRVGSELDSIKRLEKVTRTLNIYGGDIVRSLEYMTLVMNRLLAQTSTSSISRTSTDTIEEIAKVRKLTAYQLKLEILDNSN